MLVAHGADLNAKNTNGHTALAVAQASGHHAAAEALLAAGAETRAEKGKTGRRNKKAKKGKKGKKGRKVM